MRRVARFLTWTAGIWILALLVTEFVVAEHNPLAAAVTYIPQHPLILPLLPSLLLSLLARERRLIGTNIVLLAVFAVVFMGYNPGLPGRGGGDMKVMTINLARSASSPESLFDLMNREKPDILFMQEANPLPGKEDFAKRIEKNGGWHIARVSDVVIASRHPISNTRSTVLLPGSGRRILVTEIQLNGIRITAACVHFATNTAGATRRHPSNYLRGSAKSRTAQVRTMLSVLPEENVVIAGDFNLPPRGIAYKRITHMYRNAFSAGRGFGYTYRVGAPLMRIDHVFTSKNLKPVSWRAVDTSSSDHRAVVAEISLE